MMEHNPSTLTAANPTRTEATAAAERATQRQAELPRSASQSLPETPQSGVADSSVESSSPSRAPTSTVSTAAEQQESPRAPPPQSLVPENDRPGEDFMLKKQSAGGASHDAPPQMNPQEIQDKSSPHHQSDTADHDESAVSPMQVEKVPNYVLNDSSSPVNGKHGGESKDYSSDSTPPLAEYASPVLTEEEKQLFDKIDRDILEAEKDQLMEKIDRDILDAEEKQLMAKISQSIAAAEQWDKPGGRVLYVAKAKEDGSLEEEYRHVLEDPLYTREKATKKNLRDSTTDSTRRGPGSDVLNFEDTAASVVSRVRFPISFVGDTKEPSIDQNTLRWQVVANVLDKERKCIPARNIQARIHRDVNDHNSLILKTVGHPELVEQVENQVFRRLRVPEQQGQAVARNLQCLIQSNKSLNGHKASQKEISDHEAQVLEKQRQLAARLKMQKTTSHASSSKIPKKSSTTTTASKPAPSVAQKRPVIRSSSSSRKPAPITAEDAIAASMSRVAATAKIQQQQQQQQQYSSTKPAATTTALSKNDAIKRRRSRVVQLVSASQQNKATSEEDAFLTVGSSYGQVKPDDFWRHLRDWDVLTQVARTSNNNDSSQPSSLSTSKPLPNTFVSHGHYVATWAPLCLAEARAQLVSDAISNSLRRNGGDPFISVKVQTTKRNSFAMDSITVQVSLSYDANKDSMRMSFWPNDVVVLIPAHAEYAVRMALQTGNPGAAAQVSLRKYGLVGHTEYSRKSLDGLLLKVSKKWWVDVGTEDMFVWKFGSNVTALREFTALCRVESIPLRRYLLGEHLQDKHAAVAAAQQQKHSHDTHAMLNAMGGVTALGKGFTKYCQDKFNPSQLAAISASAQEYGDGGFTLIKGPPGTGKTTTLIAVLNSLHIRQFNKYYEEAIQRIMDMHTGNIRVELANAVSNKPQLLVCAPSNAAIDNVILKIMQDGFVDGSGQRYNPSMIRVGVGQSMAVKDVALEHAVDNILQDHADLARLESSIAGYTMELQRIASDIIRLRRRLHALSKASPWPLSKDWEIRINQDNFEELGRVYFVNHKDKVTTFEVPPRPEPGEKQYQATSMPQYRSHKQQLVSLVESYHSITTKLERCTIVRSGMGRQGGGGVQTQVRQQLETHILDSVHIVMTTLGTAGNRVLQSAAKFEVVVVDEAAQSVEPATLPALQLGSRHSILVGDPQQLPATVFNVSGRNTKYDRSLFQRLEEAGHKVYMLNQQYRMHPVISDFPRRIFYGGNLLDGPNVKNPEYGNPLRRVVLAQVPAFQPFTVLDLDSKEERGGTSLSNMAEARLAVHLYSSLRDVTNGLATQTRVAVITPYAQQARLLRRCFSESLGPQYEKNVEVNTVDSFQGREANIVIFSCVRAAGSHGIGFLNDVRRMNVALTRAKLFLFVIARCKSIVVNPFWKELVDHARETRAVVRVQEVTSPNSTQPIFPNIKSLVASGGVKRKREEWASDEKI